MDSATALSELKNFQSNRKGASDYYNESQNELGVGNVKARADDLRGIIRNTESTLKGVGQSVAGRTRGNLVTEAQRARLENIERQPLMEGIASQQGALSDEMASYRDLLGQAGTQSGLRYQTDTDKLASLESNYNKIYTSEQAAAESARQERAFQESIRQFNESQAQAARLAKAQNDIYARMASIGSGGGGYSPPQSPKVASNPSVVQSARAIKLSKQGDALAKKAASIKTDPWSIVKQNPLAILGQGTFW